MKKADANDLVSAVSKALGYYQDKKTWKEIQENGMRQYLDWSKSAKAYMRMYEEILHK
jgi:starch synthase